MHPQRSLESVVQHVCKREKLQALLEVRLHVSTFIPKYVLNETAFRECFREQWGITL